MKLACRFGWHQWGRWQQRETGNLAPLRFQPLASWYRRPMAYLWQERTCDDCGLVEARP